MLDFNRLGCTRISTGAERTPSEPGQQKAQADQGGKGDDKPDGGLREGRGGWSKDRRGDFGRRHDQHLR
jgi:hypothetical protein